MPRKSRTERDPEKKAFMKQLLAYYQPKTVADMQEMLKDLLKDALQDRLEAGHIQLLYTKAFGECVLQGYYLLQSIWLSSRFDTQI